MLKFFKNEQSKINEADQHLNDKKFDEIKVIGAGLPRTGTLSLKTALTQLYGGEVNLVKAQISKMIQISREMIQIFKIQANVTTWWTSLAANRKTLTSGSERARRRSTYLCCLCDECDHVFIYLNISLDPSWRVEKVFLWTELCLRSRFSLLDALQTAHEGLSWCQGHPSVLYSLFIVNIL